MIGFAIDPVLYFLGYGVAALQDAQLPGDFLMRLPFQWANLGATIVSAAVWGAARHPRLTPSRPLTLGLVYEVLICFVIAFASMWEYYLVMHHLPSLTWAYAVIILFPIILPGPPRRMLIAAISAAALRTCRPRAGDRPAAPGLPLVDRSQFVWSGSPRQQAGEHRSLPLRRQIRFRESPRFWSGEDPRWRDA